ncbi:MAG: beta-galactosidase [Phycisphaerales bacterium]|nr:beta-galactosidase [Phycisphaerales bacterium]
MPVVQIQNGAYQVGSERVPLFAGEVHYWRLHPARWRRVLEATQRLGVRVVATYVPWEYHELAPGQFDFTGSTEPPRNLVGFLELVQSLGFWVLIRPGPFIYSEWTNAGVPDRVVRLPRIGESYRREARVWMAAVTAALRPFLATQGGRILSWMTDNEMDIFSHWFEDESGLNGRPVPGFFHDFLRSAYRDVADLNTAWGTAYARIEDAQPYAVRLNSFDPQGLTRHKDYWRFQHWATAEGLRWHAQTYRELGVDVPLVANYYPGGDVQNWREVAKTVDYTGIDWYPRNEFGGEPEEHRLFLDTCRYQRVISTLPHVAELECGVWHGYHEYVGVLTPNHYRLLATSLLIAGVHGFNWYMLVGRDNWYYTPINERGDVRPELGDVLRQFHALAAEIDLPTLRKCTDTAVMLEPLQVPTDQAYARNPVLSALHAADVDFELYDPELGRIERPLLYYSGADWLATQSQQRLVDYVERGGTLVLCQQFPQRDERFRPHNGLEIAPPDRILSPLGKKVAVELGAERPESDGAVWVWDRPPGQPVWGTQTAGQQQAVENADKWMTGYIGKRWVCGYVEPRGAGRVLMLGVPMNAAIVRAVHRWAGVPLFAQAELPGVTTALYSTAGSWVLVATNLNAAESGVRVRMEGVPLPAEVTVRDLWTGTEERMASATLYVRVPRRSGGTWCITP